MAIWLKTSCFHTITVEMSKVDKDYMTHKIKNISFWLFIEKLAWPQV